MSNSQQRTDTPAKRELRVNAGLAIVKVAVGLLAGSSALLADAVRSAAGAAKSYVAVSGLRTTRGEGRSAATVHGGTGTAESAVNIAAALLFLVAGLEIAIFAVRDLADGQAGAVGWAAPATAALLIAARVVVLRRLEIKLLSAEAAVLAGSAAAWIGGAAGAAWLQLADPAAALAVGLIIMVSGYRFVAGAPIGTARVGYRDSDVAALTEAALLVDGVIAVNELRAWEQGELVVVDAVISVNPRISVLEGQEIARRVKAELQKRFADVTDVFVRVDPYDPGYPYKSNHELIQEQAPTLLQ